MRNSTATLSGGSVRSDNRRSGTGWASVAGAPEPRARNHSTLQADDGQRPKGRQGERRIGGRCTDRDRIEASAVGADVRCTTAVIGIDPCGEAVGEVPDRVNCSFLLRNSEQDGKQSENEAAIDAHA